jgi:hypothetical protein
MNGKNYSFDHIEYLVINGAENVYNGIGNLIRGLDHGETYYHFVGHDDNKWYESGFPRRSRNEIVPIKRDKSIRTVGLYHPTDWLIKEFGANRAEEEMRNMAFLPDDISLPVRFYCSNQNVYYIFERGGDFDGLLISGKHCSEDHMNLMCRLRDAGFTGNLEGQVAVNLEKDVHPLFRRGISSFILLDVLADGYGSVYIRNEDLKVIIKNLINNSKGIELHVD